MELIERPSPQVIEIRPATLFAFLKVLPIMVCCTGFMLLAWRYWPVLIWLSFVCMVLALYRYLYIRHIRYTITPEILRISRGLFFKRVDQIELYRIKDYILTQSFMMQLLRLMDLCLKSTDPENPIVWLRGIPFSNLVDTLRDHVQNARQHNRIYELN